MICWIITGHVYAGSCNQRAQSQTVCISAFLPTYPTAGPRSLEKAGVAESLSEVEHPASVPGESGPGQSFPSQGGWQRMTQDIEQRREGQRLSLGGVTWVLRRALQTSLCLSSPISKLHQVMPTLCVYVGGRGREVRWRVGCT